LNDLRKLPVSGHVYFRAAARNRRVAFSAGLIVTFLYSFGYLQRTPETKLYLDKPAAENIITQLGISTYPTYILLSKTGKILYSTYSLDEIFKQLNKPQ